MIDDESPTGITRRLQDAAVRICYGGADRVLAISAGVGADLARRFHVDSRRIRTVLNAIDLSEVRAHAGGPLAAPGNPPFMVAAGRLVHQKGFDLLVRAYAITSRRVTCRW